ncbi:MAG: sulfatase-like hydrolase/transferase, partial [Bacteroidota bacterium]
EANWEEGNYSTDFYTDKLIEYIGQNKEDGQPFFAFGAYTSPHWPLQVDKKYWEKYKGRYDEGYEALREKRLNSLKKEGLIPQNTTLPPLHESVKPWDSLSDDEKKREARKMELYAGMVNNLDYNVGRLVKYLKDNGMYENTLIVFMSDNGAAYEDFYNLEEYKVLRTYYNEEYENMGNENSYISYGSQWAEAGNAPFRYFKGYATEGGTHTPMIISGKNVKRVGETFDGFTTVQDLAPTFYALAGIKYPKTFNGKDVYPLRGKSILPFMSGKKNQVHKDNYVYAVEHYGNAMLRKGNWKITNSIRPFKKDNFALYNITLDKGELNDLKTEEPEKYAELLAEWEKFANETKLQIPTPKRKK